MVKAKTRQKSFREIYKDFVEGESKLTKWQWAGILMLVWVISGVIGWVYEFFVAFFETGEVYMQGGDLLPWINIYAFGALLLVPATYRLRRWPWLVFLVAVLITGLVELVGGWLVYTVGNGTRYWNYDHGPWAFGSINGFVCPLSVTIFGLGALVLIYLVMPVLVWLASRWSKRVFLAVAIVLFSVVMIDEVTNLCLKNAGRPTAMDFYRSVGCKYQEF